MQVIARQKAKIATLKDALRVFVNQEEGVLLLFFRGYVNDMFAQRTQKSTAMLGVP